MAAAWSVLSVQILRFSEDGLWGRLSALGLMMIGVTTLLVLLVNVIGRTFRPIDS